ncbi:MAG: glycosyltransferase [Vicinamibacterales bacterium]
MVKVGVFTDNDFEKVNGVTTSLRAAIEHAPADIQLRIYTCDSTGIESPTYLSLRSAGVAIPYYSEMKMYVPPVRAFLQHARADRLDVIHLTTPGPVGLAAMYVASRLQLPMMGSFHTHLAEYTARLSGSPRLGALMQRYLRWPYGKCHQDTSRRPKRRGACSSTDR